jgi:preprotein translocase subunit YajC
MSNFFQAQQNPPPATAPAPAPAAPPTPQAAPAPAPPATSEGQQQPPPAPAGSAPNPMQQMLPMLAIMAVVFYFLMIRPQSKQRKERDAMIASLKKNDRVLTSFGIYGIIKRVRPEDNDLVLCIDESKDVTIRVSKASIAGLDKAAGSKPEPAPEASEKPKS